LDAFGMGPFRLRRAMRTLKKCALSHFQAIAESMAIVALG